MSIGLSPPPLGQQTLEALPSPPWKGGRNLRHEAPRHLRRSRARAREPYMDVLQSLPSKQRLSINLIYTYSHTGDEIPRFPAPSVARAANEGGRESPRPRWRRTKENWPPPSLFSLL